MHVNAMVNVTFKPFEYLIKFAFNVYIRSNSRKLGSSFASNSLTSKGHPNLFKKSVLIETKYIDLCRFHRVLAEDHCPTVLLINSNIFALPKFSAITNTKKKKNDIVCNLGLNIFLTFAQQVYML